ncbi:MAG: hypothetical protein ACOYXC_11420 [Candidatus Rifleibacteriota bacterium]
MPVFKCSQCKAKIEVEEDYQQPFIKCDACGSHERILSSEEPKYKILDEKQRIRVEMGIRQEPEPEPDPEAEPEKKAAGGPKIAAPAIASRKSATGWPGKPLDYRSVKKPVETRQILIHALGEDGLDMVLQQVAGYLTEGDEARKRAKKTRVIQTLMKSKIPGELAAQAVEFAEKCPETIEHLKASYKFNLFLGLGIFIGGMAISVLIHVLAHPGRGFILFQIPFAVGFAYAVNAAINLLSLQIEALRSEKIHLLFMTIACLIIASYVIWGIYF